MLLMATVEDNGIKLIRVFISHKVFFYLWTCFCARRNIVVSIAPGSGVSASFLGFVVAVLGVVVERH